MAHDLNAAQSAIKNALDQYYDFLHDLILPPGGTIPPGQRIAVNNTLLTLDIFEKSPLYNEEIFRSFADRVVLTSPTTYAMGTPSTSDLYSEHYENLLNRVMAKLDTKLSLTDMQKIQGHRGNMADFRRDIRTLFTEINDAWREEAAKRGLKPTDALYLEEQISFYETQRIPSSLRDLRSSLDSELRAITQIRLAAFPLGTQELMKRFDYTTLVENKMPRPKNSTLEIDRSLTELDLARLNSVGGMSLFDEGQDITPALSLVGFLKNPGVKRFEIKDTTRQVHNHDSDWSVSASASYMFFSASASASGGETVRSIASQVTEFSVRFENIAEVWVRRGSWFSTGIYSIPEVQEVLKSDPKLAAKLAYVTASMIVARGLTLRVYLKDESQVETWRSFSAGGSGGFSFCGIGFGGGGGGGSSSYDMNYSLAEKWVEFVDGPSHARLLAFRTVEAIAGLDKNVVAFQNNYWDQTEYGRALLENGEVASQFVLGADIVDLRKNFSPGKAAQ